MSDVEPEGDPNAEVWDPGPLPEPPDALGGTPEAVEEAKRAVERAVEAEAAEG